MSWMCFGASDLGTDVTICELKCLSVLPLALTRCIGHAGRQELIELGTDLDVVNENSDTALILASAKGDIEMVKLLHEAKADLNVCGWRGTALHRAVGNGCTEVLKVTLNERIMICFCSELIR